MNKAIVIAKGLEKSYDGKTRALDKIDLVVQEGEWLSIMGPSGSGKTTLLNLISCLDKPTGGTLVIDSIEVGKMSQAELTRFRRDTIGLIFQQFHLVPYLTALENVMLAQYFHSIVDQDEARRALATVGLDHRLNHLPGHLSGGEQQRVCIARALINHPKIVLADEPTGNLDKANEDLVMGLIRNMHDDGHTIIMVTHDPDIAQMADRIVRLDHGKISHSVAVESAAEQLATLSPFAS